jgi:hypothetical protein
MQRQEGESGGVRGLEVLTNEHLRGVSGGRIDARQRKRHTTLILPATKETRHGSGVDGQLTSEPTDYEPNMGKILGDYPSKSSRVCARLVLLQCETMADSSSSDRDVNLGICYIRCCDMSASVVK